LSWTQDQISAAAEDLFAAEETRQQIGLLSDRHPGLDMTGAYAVQKTFVERKVAAGCKPVGWKIGLTSKAMQDALKIDTPDSGVLLDDMLFEDGARIAAGRFIQPRIEAEIAFVLGADLGEAPGREDVISATDHVTPALEILDTRIVRKDPGSGNIRAVFDTICDNAANAGLVLGSARHAPEAFDLRWVGSIVHRNGEVEETGLGAGVLNDPVEGIVWLARRLAEQGDRLRAGDIVLSGSFIRPVEAVTGSQFFADFGSFGRLNCSFQQE
jgi:2-oxo-hept-3-ene-1,7-dioate hydratase